MKSWVNYSCLEKHCCILLFQWQERYGWTEEVVVLEL